MAPKRKAPGSFNPEVEPSTRTFAEWSPVTVKLALARLMGGDPSEAAKLFDSALGDDRASSVLGTRVAGITGAGLRFDAPFEHGRAEEVNQAAAEDWPRIAPEEVISELLEYGRGLGAVAAQVLWDTSGPRVIPRLEVWHPGLLKQDGGTRAISVKVGDDDWQTITPGDGQWLLFCPGGLRRPWRRSLVRLLAVPYLAKMFAVQDWARNSEKHGAPLTVGTVGPDAQDKQLEKFKNQLRNLGSSGVVALPKGFDVKLVEALGNSSATFGKLIEWADSAITIGVLGQNLTTDSGDSGSRALGDVQNEVRLDLKKSDAEQLATCLREQLLTLWAEFNFGDRELAPWPRWEVEPKKEKPKLEEPHLKYGLYKRNEARERLGLDPLPDGEGGDEYPAPLAGPSPTDQAPPPAPAPKPGKVANSVFSKFAVRLASGDAASRARAFVEGQLYIDALAERGVEVSLEAIETDLDVVLSAVAAAQDYADLRDLLRLAFKRLDPAALSGLLEGALVVAELAGRHSVHQEGSE